MPPAQERGAESASELRRKHVRRRVIAVSVVVLALAWLFGLASPKGKVTPKLTATQLIERRRERQTAAELAAETARNRRDQQAVDATLGRVQYVTEGSGPVKDIALTFDDGPGPYTPQVLDVLEHKHAMATFFIVGTSLRDFGGNLQRELLDGFTIGNHTQDHKPMSVLSPKDQAAELTDATGALRALGAPVPRLFRPPYGSFNRVTLNEARKQNMATILWTVDTKDYTRPGSDVIVQTILREAKPGAIVLMHDAGGPREQTVAALPMIIDALRRRGYTLVSVPQLLADDPAQLTTTPVPMGGG